MYYLQKPITHRHTHRHNRVQISYTDDNEWTS